MATEFLSTQVAVDGEEPVLTKAELLSWEDTSLGCPEPDGVYEQVMVPGYKLIFEINGTTHEVHSNIDGSQIVACLP